MSHHDTPRETVRKAVTFQYPERLPQDIWITPWSWMHQPAHAREMQDAYPSDILRRELLEADGVYRPSTRLQGERFDLGTFVDEWGCVFENIQAGVHGEVMEPMIDDPADWKRIEPPWETLPDNKNKARDAVNRICAESDRFVIAPHFPRLWERYQFFRTSEEAFCDLMEDEGDVDRMLRHIHEFYLAEMEFWASTDVDGLFIMDDWGSQLNLLIDPAMWRARFKPYYRDYCELGHAHGKLMFMHSDGQIADILPDLAEVGVQAVNSQLFCMDMARLEREVKGKLAFWGEIDRQHVIVSDNPQDGRDAVRQVASHLHDPSGGIIIQFEFGPGAKLATAHAVMDEWERVRQECDSRAI